MKNSKLIYISALFLSILLALTFSALRLVSLLTEFDSDAAYYNHGATLPDVFGYGAVVALIIMAVFCYILRRSLDRIDVNDDAPSVVFTSSLVAFMIVAVFIYNLLTMGESMPFVRILAMIFAIPAALYHLLGIALPVKGKNSRLLLGVFMILWLFSVMMCVYFTSGTAINNPNKMLNLSSIAMYLLFFVNECRYRADDKKPPRYVFFGFAVIIISGMYTMPNIVLSLMRAYPDKLDITFEFISACMWIYTLIRMCSYSDLVGDANEDANEDAVDEINDTTNDGISDGGNHGNGVIAHVSSAIAAAVSEYDAEDDDTNNGKEDKNSGVKNKPDNGAHDAKL